MNVLLLTNHKTLEANGSRQDTGELWSALHEITPTAIIEFLPHSPSASLELCHPFSHAILSRYGNAGILPEALSLKKKLSDIITAKRPAIICLMDTSLLPLAVILRNKFPDTKLCLLHKNTGNSRSRMTVCTAYDDLFDRQVPYQPGQITETAQAILGLGGPYKAPQLEGLENLAERTAYNPLTRFFVAQLLCWDDIDYTKLVANVLTPSGKSCENISFSLLARCERWALLQVMAILPQGFNPQDGTLTIHRAGKRQDEIIYSAPLGMDTTSAEVGILSISPSKNDGFNVCWWFHKPGVTVQTSDPNSRTLEIQGQDLVIRQQTFKNPAPIAIQTMGCEIGFNDSHLLFASKSDPGLAKYKDIHKGETAWLIGNGPSVRTEALEHLSGKLTFGFNRLHLAYGETDFRPSYVVCGDRQMLADFGEEIARLSAVPVFFASSTRPAIDRPFSWLRQIPCFPSIFSLNAADYVTAGGSSVYVAMQLAFYMGVRKFYLYGADFNFSYTRDITNTDQDRSAVGEDNHFIRNYRAGLPWSPPELRNISSSFLTADIFMRLNGGFIRNATNGGNLEIFDRVTFEAALTAQESRS